MNIAFFFTFALVCYNLCFAPSSALHYGDALCLYQQGSKRNFLLAANSINSGVQTVLNQVVGVSDVDPNFLTKTRMYIQRGGDATRWTSANAGNVVQSGDVIRLEFAAQISDNSSSYLAYDFSSLPNMSGQGAAKFFTTAFGGSPLQSAGILNNLSPNTSGYLFKIFKINTTATDKTIYEGDNVVVLAYVGTSLYPIFLGASSNDGVNANVYFSCSGSANNPSDLQSNCCWFVSTVLPNAYIADAIADTALSNLDNSRWNTQAVNLSTMTPPFGPVALCYGDGFALKHANYKNYIAVDPRCGYSSAYALAQGVAPGNNSKFILISYVVQPGNSVPAFGPNGSLLKTPVKSGDIIAFASYGQGKFGGFEHNYSNMAVTVSKPNPPYFQVNTNSDGAARIFKLGGKVGDPISTDDQVYIVHLWGWSNGDKSPAFLGSSNLDFGSNKEIYWYYQPSGFPSVNGNSFEANFVWSIDLYEAGVYAKLGWNASSRADDGGGDWYNWWKPYFVAGNSRCINPVMLQK